MVDTVVYTHHGPVSEVKSGNMHEQVGATEPIYLENDHLPIMQYLLRH